MRLSLLLGLLVLPATAAAQHSSPPSAVEAGGSSREQKLAEPDTVGWRSSGGGAFGVVVPAGSARAPKLGFYGTLTPAFLFTALLGAARGPVLLGGRCDFGLGGIAPLSPDGDRQSGRGMGVFLNLGPAFRATLLEGPVGIALLGEASFMHVASTTSDDEPKPQLGLSGLAAGGGIQLGLRGFLLELRYLRPYWYRYTDEATGASVRQWDFARADQWLISLGGWFDSRGG